MNSKNLPLSPHIQIYKPQISSFTSILHRATGIFLYIGIVVICWYIIYYTYQADIAVDGDLDEKYCHYSAIYFIYTVGLAWSFSLYYHLCNGIRHLFWDAGKGFNKNAANRNGVLVLAISTCLTLLSFYYVFFFV
jgi:succinate dehydrogenase / fumarate reductase cytochrome b subunit